MAEAVLSFTEELGYFASSAEYAINGARRFRPTSVPGTSGASGLSQPPPWHVLRSSGIDMIGRSYIHAAETAGISDPLPLLGCEATTFFSPNMGATDWMEQGGPANRLVAFTDVPIDILVMALEEYAERHSSKFCFLSSPRFAGMVIDTSLPKGQMLRNVAVLFSQSPLQLWFQDGVPLYDQEQYLNIITDTVTASSLMGFGMVFPVDGQVLHTTSDIAILSYLATLSGTRLPLSSERLSWRTMDQANIHLAFDTGLEVVDLTLNSIGRGENGATHFFTDAVLKVANVIYEQFAPWSLDGVHFTGETFARPDFFLMTAGDLHLPEVTNVISSSAMAQTPFFQATLVEVKLSLNTLKSIWSFLGDVDSVPPAFFPLLAGIEVNTSFGQLVDMAIGGKQVMADYSTLVSPTTVFTMATMSSTLALLRQIQFQFSPELDFGVTGKQLLAFYMINFQPILPHVMNGDRSSEGQAFKLRLGREKEYYFSDGSFLYSQPSAVFAHTPFGAYLADAALAIGGQVDGAVQGAFILLRDTARTSSMIRTLSDFHASQANNWLFILQLPAGALIDVVLDSLTVPGGEPQVSGWSYTVDLQTASVEELTLPDGTPLIEGGELVSDPSAPVTMVVVASKPLKVFELAYSYRVVGSFAPLLLTYTVAAWWESVSTQNVEDWANRAHYNPWQGGVVWNFKPSSWSPGNSPIGSLIADSCLSHLRTIVAPTERERTIAVIDGRSFQESTLPDTDYVPLFDMGDFIPSTGLLHIKVTVFFLHKVLLEYLWQTPVGPQVAGLRFSFVKTEMGVSIIELYVNSWKVMEDGEFIVEPFETVHVATMPWGDDEESFLTLWKPVTAVQQLQISLPKLILTFASTGAADLLSSETYSFYPRPWRWRSITDLYVERPVTVRLKLLQSVGHPFGSFVAKGLSTSADWLFPSNGPHVALINLFAKGDIRITNVLLHEGLLKLLGGDSVMVVASSVPITTLIRMLESSLHAVEFFSSQFFQTYGLRVEYDPSKPALDRLTRVEVHDVLVFDRENGVLEEGSTVSIATSEAIAKSWELEYVPAGFSIGMVVGLSTVSSSREFGDYVGDLVPGESWTAPFRVVRAADSCLATDNPYVDVRKRSNQYFATCKPGPVAAAFNSSIGEGYSLTLRRPSSAIFQCVEGRQTPEPSLVCEYDICEVVVSCTPALSHFKNAVALIPSPRSLAVRVGWSNSVVAADIVLVSVPTAETEEAEEVSFQVDVGSTDSVSVSGFALAWESFDEAASDSYFIHQVLSQCFEGGRCSPWLADVLKSGTLRATEVVERLEAEFGVDHLFAAWVDSLQIEIAPCGATSYCVNVELDSLRSNPGKWSLWLSLQPSPEAGSRRVLSSDESDTGVQLRLALEVSELSVDSGSSGTPNVPPIPRSPDASETAETITVSVVGALLIAVAVAVIVLRSRKDSSGVMRGISGGSEPAKSNI